jgi:sialidase-1
MVAWTDSRTAAIASRRTVGGCLIAVCCGLASQVVHAAEETFESSPSGGFRQLESAVGTWQAEPEHAEVHGDHARSGRQSLRLLGGEGRTLVLALPEPLAKPALLQFWAERWTAAAPFSFVVEAAPAAGQFQRVADASDVKIGGFRTQVTATVPAGTARLRFLASSPPGKGVMFDDLSLVAKGPMTLAGVTVTEPIVPVLTCKPVNPVIGLTLRTEGTDRPLTVDSVEISLEGSTSPSDVEDVEVYAGGPAATDPLGAKLGSGRPRGGKAVIRGRLPLQTGDNSLWVSLRLKNTADLDGKVHARVTGLQLANAEVDLPPPAAPLAHRIGVAVRLRGEDGSDTYRIPGLARTNAGSLLAVYDIRYRGGADLPADIDVGCSRSTDGGRSWEPMRIVLDMGRDPQHAHDGVGDPCVFVDRKTGRVFVAALWSHGNRGWNGSGPGLTPEETGQLVMATSDDDGRTWSQPRNLTRDLKDPAWRLLLAGPGTGITMRDGTLVFPAQFRDAKGVPHSTLAWSRDQGETWQIGAGVKPNTTESQLVELGDGSIMINCRDDRGGSRTIATTRNLGKTWQLHPTDRQALPESVCMASLIRHEIPGVGPLLFFSNPATTRGRHSMTLKVSADEGLSWPAERHLLYDVRAGYGYSCLAPVDATHVGVLYEGIAELYFLRLPIAGTAASLAR